MYEHNALGYWLGLALCLTKVRSSRARCPVTALISKMYLIRVLSFIGDVRFNVSGEHVPGCSMTGVSMCRVV